MHQYYFDVLPLHPQPKPLEALISYLIRVAEENAILRTTSLDEMIGQKATKTIREWSDYPRPLESLQKLTSCSNGTLMKTTFYHLGRKFGRSSMDERNELQHFLSRSVSVRYLRYCPACLSENPYYPLTWRFLAVQGCYLHKCQILEKCGHCGDPISGYVDQLKMAWCPNCNGDLRTCPTQPLSVEEHHKAIIQFEDLKFLLSPQPWEDNHNISPKMIGQAMMFLRREKGLLLESVCQQIGLPVSQFNKLEHCFSGSEKGVSFQTYLVYAAFLGITLRDVFDLVLKDSLNYNNLKRSKREILFTESESIGRVQYAVEELRTSCKVVTRKNILEYMGIPYKSLFSAACLQSPHIQGLLAQVDSEVQAERKRQQDHDGEELFRKVRDAVQRLQDIGEPVTFQAVKEITGTPSRKYNYYPKVQAFIKQHASYLHPKTEQARLREEEIIEKVQSTIRLLKECQQCVTELAVCRIAGISRSCLSTYPSLRPLLEQHADSRQRIGLALAMQKEDELLIQVEDAILKLRSLNQRVTKKAVAAIIGVNQRSLERYSQVKVLLEKNTGIYYHYTRAYSQEKEDELLVRVKAVKEHLESSNQRVTQVVVAKILGVSVNGLMYYPKVRTLLLESKNANLSTTVQKQPLLEQELLVKLEKVIQQLEEQGISITIPKVSASLEMSSMNLYRYPQCISMVRKAADGQKKIRYERKEEQILQNIHEIIKQLKESKLPITVSAIAKEYHMSVGCLKHYSKVRLLCEQIVKGHIDAF